MIIFPAQLQTHPTEAHTSESAWYQPIQSSAVSYSCFDSQTWADVSLPASKVILGGCLCELELWGRFIQTEAE